MAAVDPTSLDPSEVRDRVLSQHEDLRARLVQLTQLSRLAADDRAARATLREGLLDLVAFLDAHMALEDDILLPALMAADAFGDVRSDRLHDHHADDRTRAEAIRSDLADPRVAAEVLVRWCERLAEDLRLEMADEEATLLRPDILRDDVITSGVGG